MNSTRWWPVASLLLGLSTTACEWFNGDCAAVEQPVVTGEVNTAPLTANVTEYASVQISMTSDVGPLAVTGLPVAPSGVVLESPAVGSPVFVNTWDDRSSTEGVPGFRAPQLNVSGLGNTGRLLGYFELTDLPSPDGVGVVVSIEGGSCRTPFSANSRPGAVEVEDDDRGTVVLAPGSAEVLRIEGVRYLAQSMVAFFSPCGDEVGCGVGQLLIRRVAE